MTERYIALTCMKNEGPFILEWVAYHKSIGIDHFLIYTNDCEDGTVEILDRLQELGHVTHRDNTRKEGQRPAHQVRAYRKARKDPVYLDADWVMVMDADEFLNVHVGDRTIQALTAAAPDANAISLTWRVFGNNGLDEVKRGFITQKLRRAAPAFCPDPFQAWGMKTLHRTHAVDLIGCHRPKSVPEDDWDSLHWVNAAGRPMQKSYYTRDWRMTRTSYSYELAQMNHYAVRTRNSYLLKCARGRGYTPDFVGVDYWKKLNRNEEEELSIQPLLPAAKAIFQTLLEDDDLRALQRRARRWHRQEFRKLAASPDGAAILADLDAAALEPVA